MAVLRALAALALTAALTCGLVQPAPAAPGCASSIGRLAVPDAVLPALLPPGPAPTPRPNIVLVSTDDMNRSDLRWMPITRRLLGSQGVTVGDFISNHPLCCPARAEMLTGQYAQNNGVWDNEISRWGGYSRLARPAQHVGRWLQDAGYRTVFIGKHLNGYERVRTRQPGWTVFNPLMSGVYQPYGFTMYNNGSPRRVDGVHTADYLGRAAVRAVERFGPRAAPFFVWVSQVPPHGMYRDGRWVPAVPAPRHRGLFPNAVPPALSSPAFNEPVVTDKPGYVRSAPLVSAASVTREHRGRIRSLQAVDEQVGSLVRALRRTGELGRTYVFFTSDNGYLMGEHRLRYKNKPYEPNLRLPLLVRGPGLPAGVVRPATFGSVDLAPTFLDIAQAQAGVRVDGRSMLPTLRSGGRGYTHFLLQAGGWTDRPGVRRWWGGVRSRSFVYVRYRDGFTELYDRRRDPAQLRNVAGEPAYRGVVAEYAQRLDRLTGCSGRACQQGGRSG
jgi:arylsulfatase A-like enzyme